MDMYSYYYGYTEGESTIPMVNKEGFSPPFNNILYIFQNFDFQESTELFHKNFINNNVYALNDSSKVEFAIRVLGLEPPAAEVEIILEDGGYKLTWEDEMSDSPNTAEINPAIIAGDIFSTELAISKKVFKEKEHLLLEPSMKNTYCSAVFQQLDQILNLFYHNRENFAPFENMLGRFFYELYDLTYPYFSEDSQMHNLRRVFDNIKKQKSRPAPQDEYSPIEKIVDMLIDDGDLFQESGKDLIYYLEGGIHKDAIEDSVRWRGSTGSFAQFIFALVQIGQYKQPGSIKWRYWSKAIRFHGSKTIANTTLKSSYGNAKKKAHSNPYINKVKQAIASSLS